MFPSVATQTKTIVDTAYMSALMTTMDSFQDLTEMMYIISTAFWSQTLPKKRMEAICRAVSQRYAENVVVGINSKKLYANGANAVYSMSLDGNNRIHLAGWDGDENLFYFFHELGHHLHNTQRNRTAWEIQTNKYRYDRQRLAQIKKQCDCFAAWCFTTFFDAFKAASLYKQQCSYELLVGETLNETTQKQHMRYDSFTAVGSSVDCLMGNQTSFVEFVKFVVSEQKIAPAAQTMVILENEPTVIGIPAPVEITEEPTVIGIPAPIEVTENEPVTPKLHSTSPTTIEYIQMVKSYNLTSDVQKWSYRYVESYKQFKGTMKSKATQLCATLGIKLEKIAGGNKNVAGSYSPTEKQIQYRSLSSKDHLFTFFHELGHHVYMHTGVTANYVHFLEKETQADRFAMSCMHLLYPEAAYEVVRTALVQTDVSYDTYITRTNPVPAATPTKKVGKVDFAKKEAWLSKLEGWKNKWETELTKVDGLKKQIEKENEGKFAADGENPAILFDKKYPRIYKKWQKMTEKAEKAIARYELAKEKLDNLKIAVGTFA